jgi:hypothetical protein
MTGIKVVALHGQSTEVYEVEKITVNNTDEMYEMYIVQIVNSQLQQFCAALV